MTTNLKIQASPALPRGLSLSDPARAVYLAPVGLLSGNAAASVLLSGKGRAVAGGHLACIAVRVMIRLADRVVETIASVPDVMAWAESESEALAGRISDLLHRIGDVRPSFGGLSMDGPVIMGILNVTPDSFSDGGQHDQTDDAIAHALRMAEQGATIIDVGGESTRPGAGELAPEIEAARVVPVVRALAEKGLTVSVDTRHAVVMARSIEAGAAIINDITALEGDPDAMRVVADSRAAVVLMHMQGKPQDMQSDPRYDCAALDIYDYLQARMDVCAKAGISLDRLCSDPGIGFGKTPDHNAELLGRLALFHGLGAPVLLGASRKRFVAALSRGEGPGERLPGSLAAVLAGLDAGVQIFRVHDVAETAQAVKVWQALRNAG